MSQMAQRLVLKRFLSLPGRRLTSQVQSFSSVSVKCTRTHVPRFPPSRSTEFTTARQIYTSSPCRVTFSVQNKDDFQERVIESEVPVVVDFHAQWCGPCKLLAPRLEKAVAKHQGKVLMAKVDIDDNTDLALEYEVSAVPTVLAMKNGSVVDQFVGVKDEDQVEAFLNKLIGPCPS
ncbi:PREDICTED: thioredoxin, mitochondrial [Nanorana parkeri]|uniref:thioredoxin, mitochondrial n=1 Tax=Nanorana parkeri TaxID=125878 RepID=UPI000854A633|nr:PREDICTED: thioredoxin, mitochondrial [Nanorana parkeri]